MYALPYILRLPFISFIAQIVNTSPSHKLYIVSPGLLMPQRKNLRVFGHWDNFSLTVPKWVPANLMLGATLRWTSIPFKGE